MATGRELKRERKQQQKYMKEFEGHYKDKDTPTYAQYQTGKKFTGTPKGNYGGRLGQEYSVQSESDQKEIDRILNRKKK